MGVKYIIVFRTVISFPLVLLCLLYTDLMNGYH